MRKSLKKPKLSQNALLILEKRYLKKDENGSAVETPQKMYERVARVIADVERNYKSGYSSGELFERFYSMMADFYFQPNSPTLMNAGTPLGQLSACFVLPVEDSMEDIFEAVKRTAIIHKTGGGTGFSFSRLRPRNDIVKSTGGIASGPVSFMRVFNEATEAVKQGGRRRGANMGILRVDHPDILEFMESKKKEGELANFNISVALTDRFMQALFNEDDYELVNPRTGMVQGKLSAKEVFKKLVYGAWKNGEPGVIFIDRINGKHPISGAGKIESTNPCGEQPLLPYESCNLGSINLAKFVKGKQFLLKHKRRATLDEALSKIDWDNLEEITKLSIHFLDNVIDANHFPFKEIENMTRANRKIGLGVMGFADMLIQLGIPYRSGEALEVAERVMAFIQDKGLEKSMEIGEKKGDFPNIKLSIYKSPMRNGTITTIAPTGTISMIAETSSGIEPLFTIAYKKNVFGGESLVYANKYFEELAHELGFYSKELWEEVSGARSVKDFDNIPDYVRDIFDTTFDVKPMHHVEMQAAFQRHVDNAVSKTINMPNDAKVEDVELVYKAAYEKGLKGLTVYRDGSRQVQVLETAKKEDKPLHREIRNPRPRPHVTRGRTYRMLTEMGTLYITINEDDEGLLEVFVQLGKSGSSVMAFTEAIGRLISLALRSGVNPNEIVKQLKGIKSSTPIRQEDGNVVFSVPDAIAKSLDKYLQGGEQLELISKNSPLAGIPLVLGGKKKEKFHAHSEADICPECGGVLIYQEGCFVCRDCGYSKCE